MLITIVVGIIAGALAGNLMKGSGYGILIDLVLGLVGGIVGGLVLAPLGLSGGGIIWSILVATLGAVILIAIAHAISGKRARA